MDDVFQETDLKMTACKWWLSGHNIRISEIILFLELY